MKPKSRMLILICIALVLGLMSFPAHNAQAQPLMDVSVVFRSGAVQDGWVLESTETSNTGGSMDSTSATFRLGDSASNQQYRAILHFNTASIPDTATITSVKLKIKRQGAAVGVDPFTTHGKLIFDIRTPFFGTANSLALGDFRAAATKNNGGQFSSIPVSGGKAYIATLPTTSFGFINLTGTTQFRLRFSLDDDNDNVADYWNFYSGNFGVVTDRPELEIQYVP